MQTPVGWGLSIAEVTAWCASGYISEMRVRDFGIVGSTLRGGELLGLGSTAGVTVRRVVALQGTVAQPSWGCALCVFFVTSWSGLDRLDESDRY
jgi:hypothetical protein